MYINLYTMRCKPKHTRLCSQTVTPTCMLPWMPLHVCSHSAIPAPTFPSHLFTAHYFHYGSITYSAQFPCPACWLCLLGYQSYDANSFLNSSQNPLITDFHGVNKFFVACRKSSVESVILKKWDVRSGFSIWGGSVVTALIGDW